MPAADDVAQQARAKAERERARQAREDRKSAKQAAKTNKLLDYSTSGRLYLRLGPPFCDSR